MGSFLTRFKRPWAEDVQYQPIGANDYQEPPSITLCELLERYPNKPWDIASLSASEFITIDFVKKHRNWKWDWQALSANPNIKFTDIMNNLNLNWKAKGVSMNPNVSSNDILNHPEIKWDYNKLSCSSKITWDIIKSRLNENWDYSEISANPNIRTHHIIENPEFPWDYQRLSGNLGISLEYIMKTIDSGIWDLEYIAERPDLTFDMIKSTLHLNWFDSGTAYCNDRITEHIIFCNPEINWDFQTLSSTKGISIKYIDDNIHKPWDFSYVCDRDDLTPEFIIKHIDRFKEFDGLSLSPKITTDIIDMFPDKPWNYKHLTTNPSIPIEYIAKHPEKQWDYERLSEDPKFKLKYEVEFVGGWSLLYGPILNIPVLNMPCNLEREYVYKHPSLTLDIITNLTSKNKNNLRLWANISSNPNITIQFVADNIDKPWNFRKISKNKNFMYNCYKKDTIFEINEANFIIKGIRHYIIQYI